VTPQQTLYDNSGRPRRLDRQIAAGGEGAIYTLADDPNLLAKLYRDRTSPQKAEKLSWMVRNGPSDLRKYTAWPKALLYAQAGGALVGFLMRCFVDFQPIHHLYSAPQRLKFFPRADWSFLACAARNCAAAFDEVHQACCLVADVNQSNVFVSSEGMIGLIDCDSFQVQADGKVFRCEVGVAHYTPPELQGRDKPFGQPRTLNHDRFGLAVLLFQLLFMGRHPYAGCYLGPDDLPFERAIQEFRFAYGSSAAAVQMKRPPGTPPLDIVGKELAGLFERAFLRGSEADNAWPSAAEWVQALGRFRQQLRTCPDDPGHKTPAGEGRCVWCAIVKARGPDYFKGVAAVATVFVLDTAKLTSLWSRIEGLVRVVSSYERARLVPQPAPSRVPLPVNLVTPPPRPRPLTDWLPYDPPDPLPEAQPVLAPASAHLSEGRVLSHFLAAVNVVLLLLLVVSVFQHNWACFAIPALLILFPAWLIQFRTHRRACAQDEQYRQQRYESAMQGWNEREERGQAQLRTLRQARREADRKRQLDYEARLRDWQQATQQEQSRFQTYEQVMNDFEHRRLQERNSRQRILVRAETALRSLEQERQTLVDPYLSDYQGQRSRLEQVQQQCRRLEAEYQKERRQLVDNQEALAREQYLRTTFLIDHDIEKIKKGRLQILAFYGIETAYDVEEDRILAVKGFGPGLTDNLMKWKQDRLAEFRFDARTGVPDADLRSLALRYSQRQSTLLAELEQKANELEGQADQVRRQVQILEAQMRPLVAEWAQARANMEVFS
jgi:DNA-binding helix-hairpin-helix protein with protein kinase domain